MATYKKINNQAVQVSGGSGGGAAEYFFDTLAEAEAALANIEEGASIFVKEASTSDLGGRVEDIETLTGDTDISSIGDGTITGAIDALSEGASELPTITYATWQSYSDEQKQAFVGYISGVPDETLNASSIVYDGTTSGSSNTNVQDELDTINSNLSAVSNRKNLKSIDITDTNPIAITSGSGNVINYANIVSAYAFSPYNATVLLFRHSSGGMYARVVDVYTKEEVTGTCQLTVFYWE